METKTKKTIGLRSRDKVSQETLPNAKKEKNLHLRTELGTKDNGKIT